MTTNERKGWPSASGMERIALCPGSWQLEQKIGRKIPSDVSESGTRIHAALALETSPESLNDDERECYERCLRLHETVMLQIFGDGAAGMVVTKREDRLWSYVMQFSGKADVIHIHGESALILDFKTGRGEVESASGNQQLRALAVLLFLNHTPLKRITVGIIQPWASPSVSLCTYSIGDLITAHDEMLEALEKARLPFAERVPSEAACKYCSAAHGCDVAHKFALTPPVTNAPAETTPEGLSAALTVGTIADFLKRAKAAEKIIEAVREEAKRRIAEGVVVPGWRLKEGATVEKITDPQKVFIRFNDLGGSANEFLQSVTVKKGTLEKSVGKITGAKGKALKEKVEHMLLGCTESKQNAPSLEEYECRT